MNKMMNAQRTYYAITEFRGNYAFLSNFYHAEVLYRGYWYANNEAAFQAQKTLSTRERQRFCIASMSNPTEAKRLGRKVTIRPDWEQIKLQCMYEICMSKFVQHPKLRNVLLATGESVLIEGNAWGDRYWGMVNGHGENHLGRILMDIREKMRIEILETAYMDKSNQYEYLSEQKGECYV